MTGEILQREVRKTLALGGPVILAQMAQMSMSFVDTLMVGRLGSQPLAAAALGNTFFFTVMIVCLGVLSSTSPLVSQAYGAGKTDEIGQTVRQALILSTLLGIAALVIFRNSQFLLIQFGQNAQTAQMTADYLDAISWGAFPFLWFGVLRQMVEGLSRPRVVTVITIGGVLFNIAFNYTLMYGKLGFPAMGLTGCGWASAIVFWGLFLCLVSFLFFNLSLARFRLFERYVGFERETFLQLVRIGWPIGVSHGLEIGLFSTTAFLMGWFGTQILAAHQIALQCAAYTFMVPMGLSIATSIRVGQATGAGDPAAARRAGWVGIAMGAAFMMLAAVVFWLFPRFVVSLFIDIRLPQNATLVELAIVLLSLAATFQVFDGIQVTAIGALRGLKDTRIPMGIALVSYWCVGLPVGCLLAFHFDMLGIGLWWGLVFGLASAAVLLSARFWWQMHR